MDGSIDYSNLKAFYGAYKALDAVNKDDDLVPNFQL